MAKLPDNTVTGFTGNGIQPAGKRGGSNVSPPNGASTELICDAGKSGGKLTSIPNGNDYSLIKKY